jgi:hypothetical protein
MVSADRMNKHGGPSANAPLRRQFPARDSSDG